MKIAMCLIAASLIAVAVSCKTMNRSDRSAKAAAELSEAERKKLDEARAEMEIGRNMAGRLLQFYGVYENKELSQYVNQIGNYVASFGDSPDRRYMFEVLDSDIVNAFACPGGYVLVTLGAIRHAANEAQLAHVLGHEAAHVGKRHMFDTLKDMNEEEMNKIAKEAEEKHNTLSPSQMARKRPDPRQSETGALLARYLSGSTAGLSVLAAAKAGMSLMLEKGLGAELEYEADAEGVKYATRAGYEPSALEDYLCRLEKRDAQPGKCELPNRPKKKKSPETILEKTHPAVPDRLANIEKVLKSLKADEIIGAKGTKRFSKYTQKIRSPKNTKKKTAKAQDSENH